VGYARVWGTVCSACVLDSSRKCHSDLAVCLLLSRETTGEALLWLPGVGVRLEQMILCGGLAIAQ